MVNVKICLWTQMLAQVGRNSTAAELYPYQKHGIVSLIADGSGLLLHGTKGAWAS